MVRRGATGLRMCVVGLLLISVSFGAQRRLDELKVSELRQILSRRGVTCHGCTEKSAFVAKVKETAHLEKGGRGRQGPLPKNPNDWVQLNDDYRVDLLAPVVWLLSIVFTPVMVCFQTYPLVFVGILPLLLLGVLKIAHKHGKHNDIPFKQYLRFQARLKYKLGIRIGNFIFLQTKLAGTSLRLAFEWVKGRSWRQQAHFGGVLVAWLGFAYAGFGAVFTVLLGFWIIFNNLGKRLDGEGSAYSVFNDFQYLDGELRMEQIEAEMRHQPIQNRAARPPIANGPVDDDTDGIPTGPLVKLGRNDKVDVISPYGDQKSIKLKFLQEHLDSGYSQVENVRYDGIIYRRSSVMVDDDD